MRRTPLIAIGAALAVLGAAAMFWPTISYMQRETLVDIGAINITADTKKTVPLSPILGGVLMAGGAVLVVVGLRKS